MGTPAPTDRYHALDALRAAMMLAVVGIHAAVLYTGEPVGRSVFRFGDPDGGPGFFWATLLLQAVSMPAFFLAAGFFAAMLAAQRGPRAMLAHRLRRITLPFLAFWPALYGLTMGGLLFGGSVAGEIVVPSPGDPAAGLRHAGTAVAAGEPLVEALDRRWPSPDDELVRLGTLDGSEHGPVLWGLRGTGADVGPAAWAAVRFVPIAVALLPRASTHHLIHLWFLWVLTLLILLGAAASPLLARVPTSWLGRRLGGFAFPLAAAVPMAVVFAWLRLPVIPPPAKLGVPLPILLGYGLFFATGALLWRHRDQFPTLGRQWPLHLLLGSVAWVAAWAVTPSADWHHLQTSAGELWARLAACLGAAVAHWQLVWGVVGVFIRYADREVRWVRYLSDASYWVYLVHLPVVLWVAAALLPVPASRLVKFPLVLSAGVGVPLLTYHLVGRRSAIGRFLNGTRAQSSPSCRNRLADQDSSNRSKLPMFTGQPGRIL